MVAEADETVDAVIVGSGAAALTAAVGGLYCAGNAMANPIGTRALGAGPTIGPCLTWG